MNAVRGAGKRVFILYLVFALAVAIVIAPRFPALNPGSITAIISRSKAVTIIRVNRSVEIGGGAYFSKLKLEGGSEGNRSLGIPASGPMPA